MGKLYYDDGLYAWTIGSKTHLEKAINNIKKNIEADDFILNKKLSDMKYSPKHKCLTTSDCPELDT